MSACQDDPRARGEDRWDPTPSLPAGDLEVTEAEAPPQAVVWRPPLCRAEYAFSGESLMVGDPDDADPFGGRMEGTWTVRPSGAGMIVENGAISFDAIPAEPELPASRVEAGRHAIALATDGRSWTPAERPQVLWHGLADQTGIGGYYPTLPASSRIGATATWAHPLSAEETLVSEVVLERWIEIDGHRAMVLSNLGSARVGPTTTTWGDGADESVVFDARIDFDSDFVVSAAGDLLVAELDITFDFGFDTTGQPAADDPDRQRTRLRVQARRVRGCRGPILPRLGERSAEVENLMAIATGG